MSDEDMILSVCPNGQKYVYDSSIREARAPLTKHMSVLVALDISGAVDTINHQVLIDCLNSTGTGRRL